MFIFKSNLQNPSNPSKLIFGVDTGYIHTITFKKPVSQLFETPFKNDEGVQKIFWSVSRPAIFVLVFKFQAPHFYVYEIFWSNLWGFFHALKISLKLDYE